MKKIKFIAISELTHNLKEKPKPSKLHIPNWYKKAPAYFFNGKKEKNARIITGNNRQKNLTFKHCMPLIDGMNAGYIIELQCDIQCTIDNNGQFLLEWLPNDNIFSTHGDNTEFITEPFGYHKRVVKYHWNILPKTPKGYSCLIMKPLAHNDLKLHAVPAIVDTDTNNQSFDIPMWVAKDYKGVIKKGTPLAQIIPFKRDDWSSSYELDTSYKDNHEKGFLSVIKGHYRNNVWNKKTFN